MVSFKKKTTNINTFYQCYIYFCWLTLCSIFGSFSVVTCLHSRWYEATGFARCKIFKNRHQHQATSYMRTRKLKYRTSSITINMVLREDSNTTNYLIPFQIGDVNREAKIMNWGPKSNNPSSGSYSDGIIPINPSDDRQSSKVNFNRNDMTQRSPDTVKYFNLIDKLAPNDMIQKFVSSSPKHVQEAAKSTIMSLFGSMPGYALDAALVTTNAKLASLLFQMQITGYMFKNAEYRMSLTKSLKGLPKLPTNLMIKQDNVSFVPARGDFKTIGDVVVLTASGETVKVDVNELMTALGNEVQALRSELMLIKNQRENELRSNLLTYIEALPEKDLMNLTSDMTSDVLDAIKMLVDALMERLGVDNTGPEVIVQQSYGSLAQLCMWQLVIGYKLREYEALDGGASLD